MIEYKVTWETPAGDQSKNVQYFVVLELAKEFQRMLNGWGYKNKRETVEKA